MKTDQERLDFMDALFRNGWGVYLRTWSPQVYHIVGPCKSEEHPYSFRGAIDRIMALEGR